MARARSAESGARSRCRAMSTRCWPQPRTWSGRGDRMSRRTLPLTEGLYDYVLSASLREHPAQARLRAATAALPEAGMQSAPEPAQLMGLLVELVGARRVLEIGCFTGYGTLAMALALPPDGHLLTLDV